VIKVSDYIANRLVELGIEQVFMVTGGGAMHLNDSFAHHPKLSVLYCHHEQACAIAAEGYFRATGKVACVCVTTGPGGLNTLTGVMGQWTDSIPVIYISGQVNSNTTIEQYKIDGLRQIGDQEVDIVSIVKPITKFACTIRNGKEVGFYLELAFYAMMGWRKGPIWINVPMDVQGAIADETIFIRFKQPAISLYEKSCAEDLKAINILRRAKRPLIIAGHGIRLANAQKEFLEFISKTNIPVVTTFNGFDLVSKDNFNYIGRVGTVGTRAGNLALQNADVILSLGSRNNIRQTSYNYSNYAPKAFKIFVDIDLKELAKPTIKPDIGICRDIKDFLGNIEEVGFNIKEHAEWLVWCRERKIRYPVVTETGDGKGINLYNFFKKITEQMEDGDIGVAANGSACVGLFQAGEVNQGTRYFWNSGCAAMGYDLPAAIGACVGTGKPVFCFAGDGSFQMNMQELQTIRHNELPIKIFYLNNGGYASIQQTQDNYFGRRSGCDDESGVSFPGVNYIADAYGIKEMRIRSNGDMGRIVERMKSIPGPVICEVFLEHNCVFKPKVSAKKFDDGHMEACPLENMYPFLSEEELASNMIREDKI